MNENKDNFFTSLKKGLEKELEQLQKGKQEERKKYESEMREFIKQELAEAEGKNTEKIKHLENKLKQFYYWLFGMAFIFLLVVIGMFFYLQNSLGK